MIGTSFPYLVYVCPNCSYPHIKKEGMPDYNRMRNLLRIARFHFFECSEKGVETVYTSLIPEDTEEVIRAWLLMKLQEARDYV